MERFLDLYRSLNLLLNARSTSLRNWYSYRILPRRRARSKGLVDPSNEVSLASRVADPRRLRGVELIFMDFRGANETSSRHEHDHSPAVQGN